MTVAKPFAARLAARALLIVGLLAPAGAMAQTPSYQSPPLQRATYAASFVGLSVPQTAAMDAVCLTGSSTRIIRVKHVEVSGTDATAQIANVVLVKRSTANSGGTSTTATVAPLDSANSAATAVLRGYTAAPTSGTSVGTVKAGTLVLNAATGTTSGLQGWVFNPQTLTQEVVLRGVAQQACVNIPAALTTAGASLNVSVMWTEQ